jgi:hypothetical protein
MAGPVDTLHCLSLTKPVSTYTLAEHKGLVSTRIKEPRAGTADLQIQAEYSYKDAPEDIEVLLIP